jgi:hypothetical protein
MKPPQFITMTLFLGMTLQFGGSTQSSGQIMTYSITSFHKAFDTGAVFDVFADQGTVNFSSSRQQSVLLSPTEYIWNSSVTPSDPNGQFSRTLTVGGVAQTITEQYFEQGLHLLAIAPATPIHFDLGSQGTVDVMFFGGVWNDQNLNKERTGFLFTPGSASSTPEPDALGLLISAGVVGIGLLFRRRSQHGSRKAI